MNEQQMFQVTTTFPVVTAASVMEDDDTAEIVTINTNSMFSSHTPSKIVFLSKCIDEEKQLEQELINNDNNESQDVTIEQHDVDNMTEDTDDQDYQDDQSNKLDTFNFNFSLSNANDSDDSLKQLTHVSKDSSTKSLYSKSNIGDDKRPRKFICRYCNKAFSLMNVLKVHERIHTGEKPYVCEICNKAFNQSGSLNRHKNTHTKRSSDNRSYSCRFCPRQFLHSSQLQDHETVEHNTEMNISISKSNETGAEDYTVTLSTPTLSSTSFTSLSTTIATTEPMTTESNILKQNHLSSQLLHGKSISTNTLKHSSSEHTISSSSNPDKITGNMLNNSMESNELDDNNPMSYINSTPNLFELDAKITCAANKFSFPYNLNLISKFLPGCTSDEFIKSLDNSSNMDTSLNNLSVTATTTSSTMNCPQGPHTGVAAASVSISNIINSVNKGTIKQDFSDITNTFTCTLCSAKLSTKTALDLHWGQHFIQQMEAQLGPITNNLISSSSSLPNPLNAIQLNSNTTFNGLNANLPYSSFTSVAHNPLKSLEQTDINKILPETSNTYSSFDNRLPNTCMDSIPLMNSTNLNSGAAAAAAAASAAIVTALSQFLLVNTPGQSLPPNPSLLAATAALTNPELLNTIMNTVPPSITSAITTNSNTPSAQNIINDLSPSHFNKLLSSLTNVNNDSNLQRAATHSNDITQKLLDIDTSSLGLKDHALNFIINKTCNMSPDSLTKSPTSTSSSSSSSSLSPSVTTITTPTIATPMIPTQIHRNYPLMNHLNQKTPSSISTNSIWPCNLDLDFTNRSIVNSLQTNRALNQLFTELDPNLCMISSTAATTTSSSLDQQFLSKCKSNNYSITENAFKLSNARHLNVDSENYSSDVEGGGLGGGIGGGNLTDSTLSGSFSASKRKRSNSPNNSTDNKSRKCNFCNKQFNCTSALRIHYRKHSGERPYICRHCGKAFSQNGTLKRHSQTCKAAYNKNNINTTNIGATTIATVINNKNNNENQDIRFDRKFPISNNSTNNNNHALIINTTNNIIADPLNLKPSNFPLLCDPIDGLSDSESQINISQSEYIINHITSSAIVSNTNANTESNKNRVSSQHICPDVSEKQLNNLEIPKLWKNKTNNNNIKLEEENCSLSNKTSISSIITAVQESDFSNCIINYFKQQHEHQPVENVDSSFPIKNPLTTHWSNVDLTKLTNDEIKLLLEKLHSIGKLYGCIACQTYYLDEKMANYHLSSMHGNQNQSNSKLFECIICGTNLNNSLLFLEHFTHCLSLKKCNGVDLLMKSDVSINQDDIANDDNENNSNNDDDNNQCNDESGMHKKEVPNLFSYHRSEGTSHQSLHETMQNENHSQECSTITSVTDSNGINCNHSALINENDQSELHVNGHCSEDIKETEREENEVNDDHTSSWSMVFPDSMDQSTVKSVEDV
ncbi:Zinc finger protein 596 [Schistosoma japonicum]|nr:Zinc finger protein 596 [Schistosoma japonicum]